MANGVLIVLEGSDGSGKTTQLQLLNERLRAAGYDVEEFDFPRYGKPSSYFVKQYLDGGFGPSEEVSPYTASLFYALDRYEAAPQIRQALRDGKVVLSDRYTGSNMAHQGSKFGTEGERRGFFLWADSLEFQLMGIPRPDINLFLRLPLETTKNLINKRAQKDNRQLDQHERSQDHLKKTLMTFDLLCQLFPKDFSAIDCAPRGKLLPIAEVSDLVWAAIKPLLPPPPRPGKPRVFKLADSPKPDRSKEKTEHSKTVAPEYPSLPRSSSSFKTKSVSLLLTNELRTVPGLDLTTELTWFKAKKFETFYLPPELPSKLKKDYIDFMEYLVSKYLSLEKELRRHVAGRRNISVQRFQGALMPLVPMAAVANISLNHQAPGLPALITKLTTTSLPEAANLLDMLSTAIGLKSSALKIDGSEAPDSKKAVNLVKQLLDEGMSQTLPPEPTRLNISAATPINEFDLIAEGLYDQSDRSLEDLKSEIDGWKYEKKVEALNLALSRRDSPILRQVRYQFDTIGDQIEFDALTSLGIAEQIEIQQISPRFGYNVPELIEDSGLDSVFLECFDRSLELHSKLQAAGKAEFAPYACLVGHKNRYQFSLTAGAILEGLIESNLSNTQKSLLKDVVSKIAERHPQVVEALRKRSKPAAEPRVKTNSTKLSPPSRAAAQKTGRHRRR